MNFQIRKQKMVKSDAASEPVATIVTEEYRATLTEAGSLNVYQTIDSVEYLVADQPWNFDAEGNRINWESLEQAVAWFQAQNGNIEE